MAARSLPPVGPRRRSQRLAAAGAAAVVFLAGMATRSALGDRSSTVPPAVESPASEAEGPGPTSEVNGAPAGFARSREGATAAAIAYTTTLSQRLLYVEPWAARAALESIAADAAEPAFVADTMAALEAARDPLAEGSGTTWWAVSPLAAKVEAFSAERARVSVWIVRVLSRSGVVVPQSSWVIETVELVWEADDWRLWSDTSVPGPTPVLDGSDLPATAAALDATLRGFELIDPRRPA